MAAAVSWGNGHNRSAAECGSAHGPAQRSCSEVSTRSCSEVLLRGQHMVLLRGPAQRSAHGPAQMSAHGPAQRSCSEVSTRSCSEPLTRTTPLSLCAEHRGNTLSKLPRQPHRRMCHCCLRTCDSGFWSRPLPKGHLSAEGLGIFIHSHCLNPQPCINPLQINICGGPAGLGLPLFCSEMAPAVQSFIREMPTATFVY
ncbi:uncharacterized protein LOC143511547 [Brachyhypopomus gauderio]|uniref:uncharacterized protein LOC143511547 n=1 Tax=Brachyhypopomus gauderio TaxID=698409 RepID=UPI00404354F0